MTANSRRWGTPDLGLLGQILCVPCLFLLLAAKGRADDPQVSGKAVPALTAFDRAMQQFMKERHIPAGTLAVIKDGRLMLSRGYGYTDRKRTRVTSPDTPFRIASLSKALTGAAIRKLIRKGKIKPDTRVFPLLGVIPPRGSKVDPRLKDVTVQHLLDHRGGWDQETDFDPFFRTREVAAALGKRGPATSQDVIRYMAGRKLQFNPGSKRAYSNVGYSLLGRVIEKVTGQTYLDYLRQEILKPLGIKSVDVARSLPRDRNSDEPYYSDPDKGPNVFDRRMARRVPAPDGAFHIEAMDAHAGLIASAPDLARFMNAYWLDGKPRIAGSRGHFRSFGALPGTFTMALQRPDGVLIAVLFNQRKDVSGLKYESIQDVMNKAADGIKRWSAR